MGNARVHSLVLWTHRTIPSEQMVLGFATLEQNAHISGCRPARTQPVVVPPMMM